MKSKSHRSKLTARLPFVLACLACQCGGGGDGDGRASGDQGGGSSGGSDTGMRAPGVPATWGEYCAEIAELVCQREMDCNPAAAPEECEIAFNVGCCAEDNACRSSFGLGVSTEDHDQCIDDTNASACGEQAPASCLTLIGDGPIPQAGPPTSLEEACYASCLAQAETNCPGVYPPLTCTVACVELAASMPTCEAAWIELNACMSEAPLSCDPVNGGASVSSEDCGAEIDAFSAC